MAKKFCWPNKSIVFFFAPEKFVFVHFLRNIEWMNEKAVFFFFRIVFFFPASKIEWMNDMWTFPWKKKHKNHTKIREKKNTTNFAKKNGFPQNPDEWPMNFSRNKKNQLVFFFSRFAGKKKQHFGIWMNEWPVNFSGKKKIRYLWIPLPPLVKDEFLNLSSRSELNFEIFRFFPKSALNTPPLVNSQKINRGVFITNSTV